MNKWLTILLVIAGVYLAGEYFKANTIQMSGQSYFQPGLESKNVADANLSNAQAEKVRVEAAVAADAVRRQREFDDGTALNVGARVLKGNGNTDAEQLGSSTLQCLGLVPFGLVGLVLLFRKKK